MTYRWFEYRSPCNPRFSERLPQDASLDFSKYDIYQGKKQREVTSHYLIPPLLYENSISQDGAHKTLSQWFKQ